MPPCPEELLFDSITARCIEQNLAVCDVTEPETTTKDPTTIPTVPTAPTKPLDPSPTEEITTEEITTEVMTESTTESTTAAADDVQTVPTAPTALTG